MSDDLRERKTPREQGDFPPQEGLRSDHAGTGAGISGPAPAGGDPEALASTPAGDREAPDGVVAPAGGGYGSATADRTSGGSGDGETSAGEDPQTDWLRAEDSSDPPSGR